MGFAFFLPAKKKIPVPLYLAGKSLPINKYMVFQKLWDSDAAVIIFND